MHCGVFGAYIAVIGRSVLEVVTVPVFHKTLPAGSHFSRGDDEVVLRTQIVVVVLLVYLSNIVQKAFERFSAAVLVEQGRERIVLFAEGFHSGEDIVRPLETLAHGIRHFQEVQGTD